MADYKRKMGIEEDKDTYGYGRERSNRRLYGPSKYDSIRPAGTEERLSSAKKEGLKDAAFGVAVSPLVVPVATALGSSKSKVQGPMSALAEQVATAPQRAAKSVKDAAKFIGSGISKYSNAKDAEADLDRELESQNKRESRGMKKGGMTSSASSRADGIAKRGKTKGRMV